MTGGFPSDYRFVMENRFAKVRDLGLTSIRGFWLEQRHDDVAFARDDRERQRLRLTVRGVFYW